jgi:hypothetical protein
MADPEALAELFAVDMAAAWWFICLDARDDVQNG